MYKPTYKYNKNDIDQVLQSIIKFFIINMS